MHAVKTQSKINFRSFEVCRALGWLQEQINASRRVGGGGDEQASLGGVLGTGSS